MDGWRALSVLLLVLFAFRSAFALPDSSRLSPLLPAKGMYYDRTQPGTGLEVDVSDSGAVIATYTSYTGTGAPTWYILEARWSPANAQDLLRTGLIGSVSAPLYSVSGGQCLGCPYPGGGTASTAANATLTWTTSRHVDVAIADQVWHMDAVDFSPASTLPSDYLLVGTWLMSITWDNGDGAPQLSTRTTITTVSSTFCPTCFLAEGTIIGYQIAAGSAPSIVAPPRDSVVYLFDCGSSGTTYYSPRSNCAPSSLWSDVFAPVGDDPNVPFTGPFIWVDAHTGRAYLDVVQSAAPSDVSTAYSNGVIGPNNIHFELELGRDRILGHGVTQGAAPNTPLPPGYWQDGRVALNLVMVRLPDGSTDRCIARCN